MFDYKIARKAIKAVTRTPLSFVSVSEKTGNVVAVIEYDGNGNYRAIEKTQNSQQTSQWKPSLISAKNWLVKTRKLQLATFKIYA